MNIGEAGTVFTIDGSNSFNSRMYSLGLCAKDIMIVEAKSLFFGMIKIAVLNRSNKIRIALRRTEASMILVTKITLYQDTECCCNSNYTDNTLKHESH